MASARARARMREMMQGFRELKERVQRIDRRQDVESREIWKAIRLLQSTAMRRAHTRPARL